MTNNMNKWIGKIAVVTGASSGIGSATTKILASHGVHVAALARSKDKIETFAKELENLPGKIHPIYCDVSKLDSIKTAFKWIETNLGDVSILVNNAGIARDTELLSMKDNSKDIQDVINTNLMGVIYCIQETFRSLKKSGNDGYIININSTSGQTHHFDPRHKENVYPVSKHGVTVVNEITRGELYYQKNKKIRCTSISPGFVNTNIYGGTSVLDSIEAALEPEDISDTIVYLLSTKPSVNIKEITIQATGETEY